LESENFSNFFGFAPTYTSGAAAINANDAIELFASGSVTDVFGDINVDGTGQPWDHVDGWTYRNDGTGPDGSTFVLANWSFSGTNALDGETSNGNADAAEELVEDDGTLDLLPLRSSDHDGMVLFFKPEVEMKCDLDRDGIIDRSDIRMIMRLRNTYSPPSDPNADFDGNGVINVLDGRDCMRMCTLPRCATP
jgi:hypothetical protein